MMENKDVKQYVEQWSEAHLKVEEEYIKSGGRQCPVCLSDEIGYTGASDLTGDRSYEKVACDDCESEWVEVFTLSAIEITHVGDGKIMNERIAGGKQ